MGKSGPLRRFLLGQLALIFYNFSCTFLNLNRLTWNKTEINPVNKAIKAKVAVWAKVVIQETRVATWVAQVTRAAWATKAAQVTRAAWADNSLPANPASRAVRDHNARVIKAAAAVTKHAAETDSVNRLLVN
jgi:hypothetical protein